MQTNPRIQSKQELEKQAIKRSADRLEDLLKKEIKTSFKERLKNTVKLIKDSPSASENRLFPITGAFNYQDMKLDYRLIRLQKFCFLVTTRSNTLLDNQHYFNLIANLVRRYDIEYKRAA